MFDLQKKVAVVTGCTSGIGLATTQLFLASGALVFGVDIAPLTDADLLKNANDTESSFAFHQADLTKPTTAQDVVKACVARFGSRIDILANIAGIMDGFATAANVTDAQLDRVLDVNLKAPIKLMGAVLPIMVEQKGGSIINISSKAGFSGAAAGLAYTASKHGLVSSF